jgi:hypothetical protein
MVRKAGVVALALGAAVALGACGSNDYRYVNNSQEGTFFRLPSDWEIFRVREEAPTDRPSAESTGAGPWHVVFDSATDPDVTHANEELPASPVGRALVIDVDAATGDALSPAELRTRLFGTDPMQDDSGAVEVIDFEPLSLDGGLRGSRVVFNRQLDDGSWVTTDNSSLVNGNGSKVYVFEVKAASEAFKDERTKINQIVDSWQVKL